MKRNKVFSRIKKKKVQFGVTLPEVLISVTVFAMLGLAIYSMFSYILRVEMQARDKVLAAKVASDQLEIVRNMKYDDIGVINGSPAGALPQSKTITVNNTVYTVAFDVRYVDDPFDGTAGGSPNDTNPADYKLIQAEVSCAQCAATPIRMTTEVAPKGIEGAGTYGFLFIKVTKKDFLQPVPQASVHIESINLDPQRVIDSTTDNNGELKILDLLPGTEEYHIVVTKTGYSSDFTVTPGPGNLTPKKPDATITLGTVTPVDFQIDSVSTLNISTLNENCGVISGPLSFNIHGEKNLAKSPDIVYKYSTTFSTDFGGNAAINNLEWDTYSIEIEPNQGYEIVGFIPLPPFTVEPGSTYSLKIILAANSSNKNSLRVTVKDGATLLPLSGIDLGLRDNLGNEYLPHPITGQGYFFQTDWTGASAQRDFSSGDTGYWSTDGNLDFTSNGEIKLNKTGPNYASSGELVSSTFDTGSAASNFVKFNWTPMIQPPETGASSVKFQIATSNDDDDSTVWTFLGPDGTGSTYYDETNQNINSIHNNYRFVRYKIILSTLDLSKTPSVSDVSISFNSACAPPGQVIFTELSNGNFNIDAVDTAYPKVYLDYNNKINVTGATNLEINMLK